MDWSDSPEQARLRDEVRTFIAERFPRDYTPNVSEPQGLEPEDPYGYYWAADRRSPDPVRSAAAMAWAHALAERGWAAPHWPTEYGGAGLSEMEHLVFVEELALAGVPTVGGIGVMLLGPTLIAYGSEEQRQEHLPRILSGEVVWAQGFSEPEAGSDLANLRMKATRDGDTYVLNGQKIWTSHAQYSDWIFVLAVTDPEAERNHRGMSFLMLDINTPGVTVQPIEDMRGDEPFNEVFFEDVRVPVANRIGEENRGWYVGMATLDFERSGVGGTIKYLRALERLAAFIREHGDGPALRADWPSSVRHEIAQRRIEIEVLRNLALRTISMQAQGEIPNYEASVNLLFSSQVHQRLGRTGARAFGMYGTLSGDDRVPMDGAFVDDDLDAVPHTILSGSSEIQRNVIATRGLRLPRE